MAGRKQSILKRDERRNVVYDDSGNAVVDRVVKASRSDFAKPKSAKSGPITARTMTDEERKRYGLVTPIMAKEERRRIGAGVRLMTDEERARYGY